MNKGGCDTGRKTEPKGGCKVGKKNNPDKNKRYKVKFVQREREQPGYVFNKARIIKDNLHNAVGIPRTEANQMDFFDLMKNLPGELRQNIGGQVKADLGGEYEERVAQTRRNAELQIVDSNAFAPSGLEDISKEGKVSALLEVLKHYYDGLSERKLKKVLETEDPDLLYRNWHRAVDSVKEFVDGFGLGMYDDDNDIMDIFIQQLDEYSNDNELPNNLGKRFEKYFTKEETDGSGDTDDIPESIEMLAMEYANQYSDSD